MVAQADPLAAAGAPLAGRGHPAVPAVDLAKHYLFFCLHAMVLKTAVLIEDAS